MFKKLLLTAVGVLIVASMVLTACTTPTPEVIKVVETVEKIVEKEGVRPSPLSRRKKSS